MKRTFRGTRLRPFILLVLVAFSGCLIACNQSPPAEAPAEKEEPQVSEAYKAALEGKKGKDLSGEGPADEHGFLSTEDVTKDSELQKIIGEMVAGHFSGEAAYGQLKGRRNEIVDDLYKGLQHKEPNVRSRMAETLGYFSESKETTTALLATLKNDPDGDVRSNVALAMVEYKSHGTVSALIRVLREDENDSARGNAAWALYALNDGRSEVPLMAALRDVDAWVRIYAVKAMKKRRVKAAIPHLKAMRGDQSPTVRSAVEKALKSLGAR
jgi:hypothetical protein